ncbi:MAG TPA: nitrilase-related carbon-nitrogen hydrolase, partial [Spirochaetota bacterium]|nr:nitrilase-related carbon-nitrogen hydrolase [Spirochaetota bacterium]
MYEYGFVRIAGAVPFNKVGGIEYNKKNIVNMIKSAYENSATIVVFPELSITSYTCQDLINHQTILEQSLAALTYIKDETKELDILSIVGLPIANGGKLFNCAAALNRGKILALIPKSYVPGYNEFYENRWFAGGDEEYSSAININGEEVKFGVNFLFKCSDYEKLVVGVEICEDLRTPIPPSSLLALSGATIVCNLSASGALVGKKEYITGLVKNQSARCISGYIYVSSGVGESTTDMVFDAD